MTRFADWLALNWLPAALVLLGLLAGAGAWLRHRRAFATSILAHVGAALILAAAGAWLLSEETGWWVFGVAGGALILALGVLVATGAWSPHLARALAGTAVFGLGGAVAEDARAGLEESWRVVRSLEVVEPWWLLGLLTLPLIVLFSFRSLAGLGPVRRAVAIVLRCSLIAALVLALTELRLRQPIDNVTVLFLVDRSLSIPDDPDPNAPPTASDEQRDRRARRIRDFINNAVRQRGRGHVRDRSGVIAFGRKPRLVLPPADVKELNYRSELDADIDRYHTDIAAALKLALASFPEGTGRRVVLLSDGNENLGDALAQARLAKTNGVEIDVVPLAAGQRAVNEVLVQSVEAPPRVEEETRVPVRVLVRNATRPERDVRGTLELRQRRQRLDDPEGPDELVPVPIVPDQPGVTAGQPGAPAVVLLKPGLNAFRFQPLLEGGPRRPTRPGQPPPRRPSYSYEAIFSPLPQSALVGDRPQNNRAFAHVIGTGKRRVLFIEGNRPPGQAEATHALLIRRLAVGGQQPCAVRPIQAKELPVDKNELGLFLSNFDTVVLANVPAEELTTEQMEALRSNTYDQGCGLVMIGGPNSFGAGGYRQTAVEQALPVDCDIKSLDLAGKGGLVLIFHASEIANGVYWQKEVAKLAIKKLSAVDMVGLIYWNFVTRWHIEFQPVGDDRGRLVRQVERMTPNDMPDCNPALQMALDELTSTRHQLATKHVIFISDGDHWTADTNLLRKMKSAGITVTTVCITSHGQQEKTKMAQLAEITGGAAYAPTDPSKLPAIYLRETRRVSQSYLVERQFQPALLGGGPAEGLRQEELPPLFGFVRTSLKQSKLALPAIDGPRTQDQEYPLLAYWQYGLGRAVAFTSDARTDPRAGRTGWDKDWAASEMYQKFWQKVIGWTLRGAESKNEQLSVTTEYRDGKVRVTVDARDPATGKPLTDLQIRGGVTPPIGTAARPVTLRFEQKNSGQYEAEFPAEEAGSYFITVQSTAVRRVKDRDGVERDVVTGVDSVQAGVSIPYSPEFADLEANPDFLKRLADLTGGQVYTEDDVELADLAKSGGLYRPGPAGVKNQRPFWYWLLLAASLLLVADVAVRRIAPEPGALAAWLAHRWERLRGRAVPVAATPQFLDRLRSVKTAVGERAQRKFEAPATTTAPPPPRVDEAGPPTAKPAPAPPKPTAPPPPPTTTGEDYFEKLRRAKRQAMGDKEKDEGEPPK